jgi:HSP20 family protein
MEEMFRAFDRDLPLVRIGAGAPAVNVAETKDSIEVTVKVAGVDDKDINIKLGRQSSRYLR